LKKAPKKSGFCNAQEFLEDLIKKLALKARENVRD